MKVLGIECSSSIMSVSLKDDKRLFESSIQDGFKNSENLMPLIDHLFSISSLSASDLDLIAVAAGPGSFTGLRIAMSTAKGISFGTDTPIVSVPTLEAYALGLGDSHDVIVPVIDARKKRFFASAFLEGKRLMEDRDIGAEDLLNELKEHTSITITGPDAHFFTDLSENDTRIKIDRNFSTTSATRVIELGMNYFNQNGPDPSGSGPVYLRKSEAEISMFGE